jgi:hypothetical protein
MSPWHAGSEVMNPSAAESFRETASRTETRVACQVVASHVPVTNLPLFKTPGRLPGMCAAFELNSRVIRPGKLVGLWRRKVKEQLVWAGFAQKEKLASWQRNGGELVDVPAGRFAERSDRDRQLRWGDVAPGLVIRGLVEESSGKPLLKIVTRASTPEEVVRFEHDRMPVIEAPIFSGDPVEVEEAPNPQGELF